MLPFILCIFNCAGIFFEFIFLLNLNFPPNYGNLNLIYWLVLTNIIIQVILCLINILYIMWNILTCCLNRRVKLSKFGILKALTIFYLLSTSFYCLYLFFDNLNEILNIQYLFYFFLSYFIWFGLILLTFIIYRLYICYVYEDKENQYYALDDDDEYLI